MSDDRDDVVVVGGGLAGHMAALTAALEEPVASVRLLVTDADRFEHETGLVDLLGYTPDGTGPVSDPFAEIAALPAAHPYSLVGSETLRRALSFFEEVSGYSGEDTESNALVPTCHGTLKPTYMYPESVAAGVASNEEELLLVGFERVTDLHADHVAAKLDETLPYDVESTTLTLPLEESSDDTEQPPGILSEQLDDGGEGGPSIDRPDVDVEASYDEHPVRTIAATLDENTELDEDLPARRAVAGKIRNALDIEPRIGFPAVLGLEQADDVRSDLESILQADPFEIPLGTPSLLGRRLASRLRSELDDAGVTVESDVSVTGFETDGQGRIEQVSTGEQTHGAAEFVLTTGGLAAGGLQATQDTIVEPHFDCHVPQPPQRTDWVAAEFLGDHEFARTGLPVDEAFRPLTADDDPVFQNLRAAGQVLAGGDFAAEQSESGVSVVTGYHVGSLAVEW